MECSRSYMDQLTNDERALAWYSAWHPSFDGVAIVDADGTIRSANPQFCQILGVTLAQLVGKRYQDLTPALIREQDELNAKLVVDGLTESYLLRKTYDFGTHKRDVMLLVNRVPKDIYLPFQFFVSRIILTPDQPSELGSPPPKRTSAFYDWLAEYFKPLGLVLGTIIGTVLIAIMEYLKRK